MIFVTVGTTMPFDELIQAVDELAGQGIIREPVVCQIGTSAYQPRHCEFFRFEPSIDDWIAKASLVIGHGGTGTVLSLLVARKPFIAVANPRGAEDHQAQFLERLSRTIAILWTRDVSALGELIARAADFDVQALEGQRLADDLRRFLNDT